MEAKSLNELAAEMKLKTPRQVFGHGARFFVNLSFKKWTAWDQWSYDESVIELTSDAPIAAQIAAIYDTLVDVTDIDEAYTVVYNNGVRKTLDWFMLPV